MERIWNIIFVLLTVAFLSAIFVGCDNNYSINSQAEQKTDKSSINLQTNVIKMNVYLNYNNEYFETSADSVKYNNDTLKIYFFKGTFYTFTPMSSVTNLLIKN